MANRLSEADRRAVAAPSIGCGPSGAIVLGALFSPISSKVWLNVTVAAVVSFHMMDGNTVSQAFPVGFVALDIQCDTVTLVSGTATASALSNVT